MIAWNESDGEPSVQGSIVATLTETLFADVDMLVMDVFTSSMTSFRFDDYCAEQSLGRLSTIKMCLSNMETLHYTINKQ